jgi:hypothetical protein
MNRREFRNDVPGLDRAFEVDLHGRSATRVCYRNPSTRNFWLGLTEDYLRSATQRGARRDSVAEIFGDAAYESASGGACRARGREGFEIARRFSLSKVSSQEALENWTVGQQSFVCHRVRPFSAYRAPRAPRVRSVLTPTPWYRLEASRVTNQDTAYNACVWMVMRGGSRCRGSGLR